MGLFWFLSLTYRQRYTKYFIITPFSLFGFQEILSIWGVPLNYAFKDMPLGGWEILVIGSAFLAFITGYFLAGGSNLSIKSYLSQPITAKYSAQYYFMGVLFSVFILIALGVYYYRGAPPLGFSVFSLLSGDASIGELAGFMSAQRFELTKSHWFGGEYRGQGIITTIQRLGWRFVFAVSLIMYLKLKTKKCLNLTILIGSLTIMFQAGAGERGPFVFSVLYVLIVLSMMQKIKPRYVFILSVLGFAFLMGMTYFSTKVSFARDSPAFVQKLASQLIERILLGNSIHDLETIEFIDSGIMEKRFGMNHIEHFVSSFPGVRMGEPLCYRLSALNGSTPETCSGSTYLGFVYSDFGYLGVLVIFFFIGAFLAYVQKLIFNKERDIIIIVMSSMITFYLSFMGDNGFIGFLSNMVMVIFFWGLFHLFGSFFSQISTSPLSRGDISLKREY